LCVVCCVLCVVCCVLCVVFCVVCCVLCVVCCVLCVVCCVLCVCHQKPGRPAFKEPRGKEKNEMGGKIHVDAMKELRIGHIEGTALASAAAMALGKRRVSMLSAAHSLHMQNSAPNSLRCAQASKGRSGVAKQR
jgi:hypothetical protein